MINENNIRWVETFAFSLEKYTDLREVYERYYHLNKEKLSCQMQYLHLLIKERNFDVTGKHALTIYKGTKDHKFMFFSILSNFIKITETEKEEDIPKKLMIVNLFLDKIVKELKIVDSATVESRDLHKNIVMLKTRTLLKQKETEKALAWVEQYKKFYEKEMRMGKVLAEVYAIDPSDVNYYRLVNYQREFIITNTTLDSFEFQH